jgi:pimeloyl-ACP methyl ester carboxylesterase
LLRALRPAAEARDGLSRAFVHTCEIAFTDRTDPVVLPGAGHFLQWERADLFNPLVIAYFGDLRVRREI